MEGQQGWQQECLSIVEKVVKRTHVAIGKDVGPWECHFGTQEMSGIFIPPPSHAFPEKDDFRIGRVIVTVDLSFS